MTHDDIMHSSYLTIESIDFETFCNLQALKLVTQNQCTKAGYNERKPTSHTH